MKAELGRYRMRGFSMFKKPPGWDELIFLPGTLTRFVIEGYREKCDTKTVLGRFASKPLELDIPVYITGMSFGALARGEDGARQGRLDGRTATCSGEGGMIPPERDLSTKWYYQVIQSRYGFNPHHLMLADGVEFFIGQGCKVGLGGHLMGQKVTEQVAEMRSLPAGIDQRSPARHPDWLGPDDLSLKVQETREATNYEVPIQLKLGAARVYDDVRMAAKAPTSSTSTAPRAAPAPACTSPPRRPGSRCWRRSRGAARARGRRARRRVDSWSRADPQRRRHRQVPGPRRRDRDRHSALMALNCNKEIPGVTDYEGTVGVPPAALPLPHRSLPGRDHHPGPRAAQAPRRRRGGPARLNFLHTLTLEVQMLARAGGKTTSTASSPRTWRRSPSRRRRWPGPAGGHRLHPGGHRGARAGRDPTLLDQYLENPVDYLLVPARRGRRIRRDPRRPGARAREGHLDRRRVPLRAALSLPGGHLAGGGHRPRGGDPGQGHELARGRRASRRRDRRRSSTATRTRS